MSMATVNFVYRRLQSLLNRDLFIKSMEKRKGVDEKEDTALLHFTPAIKGENRNFLLIAPAINERSNKDCIENKKKKTPLIRID